MVEQWDRQDDARRIGSRSRAIAEDFALERPLLMPLAPNGPPGSSSMLATSSPGAPCSESSSSCHRRFERHEG
ncbi:hypothetical protein [Streptomyces pseudogriseolus]|uniref:hypothetical protein n=1 Tax=Streptomyces pseudogriseolus TaxID=36817 RepID=UPI003FA2B811